MKISYTENEVNDFYYYHYEWIDYLDFIKEPSSAIDNYGSLEATLKKKLFSVGWDGENKIGIIWIPPFLVGSAVLGGGGAFLDKYSSKTFNKDGTLHPNAWTKGIILFHVKNNSNGDGNSILLSPIELDIPNYALSDN